MAYPPFLPPASSFIRNVFLRSILILTLVASSLAVAAQAPATPQEQQQPAPSQPTPGTNPQVTAEPQAVSNATVAPEGAAPPATEDAIRSRLVGKQFFLRGGWLDDSINFTEHGFPIGHPATGSFTLSAVQINKVEINKHHIEMEGTRYALHFLGNMPYENSADEVERVDITRKKRTVHISIARERLLKSKKYAHSGPAPAAVPSPASPDSPDAAEAPQAGEAAASPLPVTDVTYTTSPAHAAQVLGEALDRIFAPALDDKMRQHMPEFWQLYYQSQKNGKRFDPHDGSIFRANTVDQQAKLLTSIAPQSNEFAQANGIVGQALYRVVVGADGTPQQIAAERPIGFGLDENAVAAIRKATFQPAVKNGQPVAELLDLSVLFRIYSDRTAAPSTSADAADPSLPAAATPPASAVKPALPGPYSTPQPAVQQTQPDAAPQQDAAPAANPPAAPQTAPSTSPQEQ